MNNDLVSKIIDKKLHCVFISPHFDDAILSCGSLIAQLSGKVEITVINVFTKAHKKPYTLASRKFLMDSGISDAEKLYEERKEEDKRAFSSLDVKIINLDLEDALFRRKIKKSSIGKFIPEINHFYPTYQLHIIKKIAANDHALIVLENKLKEFKMNNHLIFAPVGVGNHADHRIARLACENVFDRYILYSDFPYSARLNTIGKGFDNGEEFRLDPDMEVKTPMIKAYKTQFSGLFKNGIIPAHQEVFFSNQKL